MPDLQFLNNVNIQGNETVHGNELVTGNETVSGNSYVTQSLTISGTTLALDTINLSGNFNATGDENLTGNLNVDGVANFAQNINALSGISTTGNVVASAFFGDGSNLTGIASVSGYLPLSGGVLTDGLSGTTAEFASVTATNYYGDGTYLSGVVHGDDSRLTDSRTPTGSAGGDLGGTYPDPTVTKIQGYSVSTQAPTAGQILQWNGSAYVPGAIPAGGSGGGGMMYYLNYGVAVDSPTAGLSGTLSELGRTAMVSAVSAQITSVPQNTYTSIATFLSDRFDPSITSLPAGIWDFNIWASTTATTTTEMVVRIEFWTYSETLSSKTLIAASDDVSLYNPTVTAQYDVTVIVPQTTVDADSRLYADVLVNAASANTDVTLYFGGNKPAHVHTTIPSVGGSGLVKVINGVVQSPATLLFDADVAANAEIAQTKISGLTAALAGKVNATDVIPISAGGTGATDAATARANLGTSPQIDIFTSTDTWTKPAGAQQIIFEVLAGGGGGGKGIVVGAGTTCSGGGGGGSGGFTRALISATDLTDATYTVTVGAGGAGGTSTAGIAGNNSSVSGVSYEIFVNAIGGGGGGVGVAGASSTSGSAGLPQGNVGGSGNITTSGGSGGGLQYSASGGGAGGGCTTSAALNGGTGGNASFTGAGTALRGSGSSIGNGGNGGTAPTRSIPSLIVNGGGGGGGGATIFAGANGGTGGNATGFGGGGGGGGSVAASSGTSGNGGDGAPGIVVITTYF